MPTLKICIQGMRGVDDEATVEQALRRVRGVYGVVADRAEACASVDYEDDEALIDELLATVRGAGFAAELGG